MTPDSINMEIVPRATGGLLDYLFVVGNAELHEDLSPYSTPLDVSVFSSKCFPVGLSLII